MCFSVYRMRVWLDIIWIYEYNWQLSSSVGQPLLYWRYWSAYKSVSLREWWDGVYIDPPVLLCHLFCLWLWSFENTLDLWSVWAVCEEKYRKLKANTESDKTVVSIECCINTALCKQLYCILQYHKVSRVIFFFFLLHNLKPYFSHLSTTLIVLLTVCSTISASAFLLHLCKTNASCDASVHRLKARMSENPRCV